jgi:hypothetical protein
MSSTACIDDHDVDIEPGQEDEVQEIRVDKILAIRRQLGEGRYCIADRLDVVVDRILEDILQ